MDFDVKKAMVNVDDKSFELAYRPCTKAPDNGREGTKLLSCCNMPMTPMVPKPLPSSD